MRVGVFVLAGRFPGQDDGAALRRARDAVVCAEAAGFDDAWIAEHHFMSYGTCPSAITFAAHALGGTSPIAIGTAVSVLSTADVRKAATRWQFWKASFTPKCRSSPLRMASEASAHSSWPRSVSRRTGCRVWRSRGSGLGG